MPVGDVNMKKVKIAQIGTSRYSHGSAIWNNLLSQREIFDVVGYAFPEGERKKFPEQMQYFDGHIFDNGITE